jgi:hypothetical protein
LVLVVVLAGLALAPPARGAAHLYVAPNGGDPQCEPDHPCNVYFAMTVAADGDELILEEGDYGSSTAPLTATIASSAPNLDVHGAAGQPRPRIFSKVAQDMTAFEMTGAGTKVRHLEVHHKDGGIRAAAFLFAGADASDIVVTNIGRQNKACVLLGSAVLSDSVCQMTGLNIEDSHAISSFRQFEGASNATIRNVTAIASGAGSMGIQTRAGNTPADSVHFTVTNTIARGAYADVGADELPGMSTGTSTITPDHSNFRFQSQLNGGVIENGFTNGNQRFMNVTFADDYHQAAGAVTIDAGTDSALNGPIDIDGDARILGARTDIGADEFVPPPAGTGDPGATPSTTGGSGPGTGGNDPNAPGFLGAIAFAPSTFAAAASGDSVQSAARHRVGTTVTFRLDEAATVRFTVERAQPGRRSGRRCVKPAKRNRRARKCTRYVLQRGSFDVPGALGQTRFRFTGRLRNRKLRAGRYKLVAVATDAAGNASAAKRGSFRIVRR